MFCWRVSPEFAEVFPEHLQGSLQEVLDGVTLLHLHTHKCTRTHTETNKEVMFSVGI